MSAVFNRLLHRLGIRRLVGTGGLALAVGLVSLALADPRSTVASKTVAGKTIAVDGNDGAATCASCHDGKKAGVPRLAGLNATYHVAQLAAFADGGRQDAGMAKIAKAMSATAMADVAAHYASLVPSTVSSPSSAASAPLLAVGAELAQRGDWGNGIPPCAACHGRNGHGVGVAFPPIAGQPASYIAGQLNAWKSSARQDPRGLMRTVAARLSDAHIAAVSAYYATLPASAGNAR